MAADFKVVWYGGFEHAIVRANSQHAAMWFGRHLDRAGMAVWKLNLSGDDADKMIAAAEESGLEIDQVDLATLRPVKQPGPPSRSENTTQKMILLEVKNG